MKKSVFDVINEFSHSEEEEDEENNVNPTSHGMNNEDRPQVSREERNRLLKQRTRRLQNLRDENDQYVIRMRTLEEFRNSDKKLLVESTFRSKSLMVHHIQEYAEFLGIRFNRR